MNLLFKYEQRGSCVQLVSNAGYIATSFASLAPLDALHARSVGDAVAALADTEQPCVLAGGTDLPAKFNEGYAPKTLIDISRLAALREITEATGELRIGALVTHFEGAAHPLIRKHLPGFAAAWAKIANVRVRFSATIGGNLMARRTRYEGSILLSALGARARLESKAGTQDVPVEALWTGGTTPAALLTSILIPLRRGQRFDYERSLRPIMTQAIAYDDSGEGRVVTATEFAIPVIRPLRKGQAQGALRLTDPVTSQDYLARVSDVFLSRQRKRGAS